ncbi:glycoside hydrolase family 31 protein [Bacillus sp. Marseille-P3661]|uniref:glycoside hydrolase family 31 protein n=1 Tax=Bacillus sp. Marseille-P3661 TaxID=1936234 RepID=UPI000C8553AF|nr:TIM-barrel domain-containing protein [Bacillus sp. Marseille-P3661]
MLEDSSFAIHPSTNGNKKATSLYDIGSQLSFQENNNSFDIHCEAGFVKVIFYREDIVRIVMNPTENVSLKTSAAVIKGPEDVTIHVQDSECEIMLSSNKLVLKLNKSPFRITAMDIDGSTLVNETVKGMGHTSTNEVICFKEMLEQDHFYGFGEKTGFLNKRGEKMTMWNSDVFAPHNPETDSLYQSIPFFMTIRDGNAHGIFFDNTFKTTFDLKSDPNFYSFKAEGGQLDYYLFAGPTPKDVLEQYTTLTGRMPLPPKWALGYHQSKYSYQSESEVKAIAESFLTKEIPLDAIFLDIHYMDEYRVFTFDKNAFPNPRQLIAFLKESGIHVVPIVDPGVKKDPAYKIYREGILQNHFCKYIEGDLYFGEVWPGISAFPDFSNSETQQWWGKQHQFYTEQGIEGIWNDMNEPAVFNESKTMDFDVMHDNDGDPKTHREFHNIYGLLMGKATYEGLQTQLSGKRPFLLTRAGYAGIQRYAAVWTGDNRSFWEHLQLSLPMCMNLGLSGVAFCGPDVGGFAHDCTGELLTRWTQVGAFTPYFRNHNALDSVRQEPWAFGEKYEKIIKKYIQLRYKWLPHLYSLFAETSKTGIPVMRPLVLEYPNDQHVINLSDQFLIGDNVLVAPIMQPDTYYRVVYLPDGKWVNYWTDEVATGNNHILVHADLETLPVYIKRGSCILQGSVKQSTKTKETDLQLHVYPVSSGETTYTIYDDDGQSYDYQNGEFWEQKIHCQFHAEAIDITIQNVSAMYKPSYQQWKLIIHHTKNDMNITVNGVHISTEQENVVLENELLIITLNID